MKIKKVAVNGFPEFYEHRMIDGDHHVTVTGLSEESVAERVRLLTAAPDLLEALESMLHRFGHLARDPGMHGACNDARKAIKDATGRTPRG